MRTKSPQPPFTKGGRCLKTRLDHVTLSVAKGLGWWAYPHADEPLPRFFSAGIGVAEAVSQRPSSKLKDIPNLRAVEYIKKEFGVDLSERDRRQLTSEMIDEVDLTIMIHEREAWPDYLKEGGKME